VSRRAQALVVLGLVAALAGPAIPAGAQQGRSTTPTLEALAARVKHFEDKEEITNILINYGRALDSRDFKAYASLFTKDGSWSGGTGSVSGGPQAIYDFMMKNIGGVRAGGTPRPIGFGPSYHIMSSFKIDVTGDTATASSRWAFVTAARGPGIQVAGRYEDTLVREDGVWKIKSRQAFNDLPAPTAAASASGPSAPNAPPASR
jgi:ketosteroid isomerase-like protein